MRKREAGFSLVELFVTIAVIGFVLAAGSEMFVNLLRGYKQQNRIAETNIEGVIGLEMLRRDIESAGYGLPWSIPGTTYAEVSTNATAEVYNDSTSNPPRAFLCGNNITGDSDLVSGADYMVVKAVNLPRNDACTKWAYLLSTGGTTTWNPASEDLDPNDHVIVLSPGTLTGDSRVLVGPIGAMSGGVASLFSDASDFFSSNETRVVYGIDPDTNLIMPFNRADYRVSMSVTIPGRCAAGTGVLVKAVVSHSTGGFNGGTLPLLDCVADMQVVTYLDRNADGTTDDFSNGLPTTDTAAASAQTVRNQLKEIHIYILAHEGQRDSNYTHPTDDPGKIWVGEPGSETLGRKFNLAANITNWRNYRWKVYTLVVRPNNLR